ncbi:radical SAM/SPASM domain-containing protein [Streptomyces sp. NPDC021093]|uniref:radical SAM/SPASM domain-containing protein n=1 Tax=Streptomyces sp. NPDC021093 TaxID=3365112 RepID=UPI00379C9775
MDPKRNTPLTPGAVRRHTLAIAVTNRCPLRCDFCCVPPGPGDLEHDLILDLIDQAGEMGVFRNIGFTGGEPLIRRKLILEAGLRSHERGMTWGVTTGMGWARNADHAVTVATELIESRIANITVSADASHLIQRDPAPVEKFIRVCIEADVQVTVSCTSNNPDPPPPLDIPDSAVVDFHYVSPTGYAKGWESGHAGRFDLRRSNCPMKEGLTLSVWPDGSVYPCCSTYVVNKERALIVGNIRDAQLSDVLQRALSDPYLATIREVGFAGLIVLTASAVQWGDLALAEKLDPCHLCSAVSAHPETLSTIRATIAQSL